MKRLLVAALSIMIVSGVALVPAMAQTTVFGFAIQWPSITAIYIVGQGPAPFEAQGLLLNGVPVPADKILRAETVPIDGGVQYYVPLIGRFLKVGDKVLVTVVGKGGQLAQATLTCVKSIIPGALTTCQ